MRKPEDIRDITITLKVGSQDALFIRLHSDGSVKRRGDGSGQQDLDVVYIGMDQGGSFQRLVGALDEELLDHMGGYATREMKGAPCELVIAFEFADGQHDGFVYEYGSMSQGPPPAIRDLVHLAVRETDACYHNALKHAKSSRPG